MDTATMKIPPPEIRRRIVNQDHSEDEYVRIGRGSVRSMEDILRANGTSLDQRHRILDFGCGCGRTIQFLRPITDAEICGTDIDLEGVGWCMDNISDAAAFSVNDHMPPLAYRDRVFDFIYALSVFTHLSADMQKAWLTELTRILEPGGLIYLTFNGEHVRSVASDQIAPENLSSWKRAASRS